MNIKKGDTVVVISGEDKGKKSKVIAVSPKTSRVLVENVNMVTTHVKPNMKVQNGGIFKKEAPIHVSNVMLWDEKAKSGTRIRKERTEDGVKRVSVKSGKQIESPKFERGRRK